MFEFLAQSSYLKNRGVDSKNASNISVTLRQTYTDFPSGISEDSVVRLRKSHMTTADMITKIMYSIPHLSQIMLG